MTLAVIRDWLFCRLASWLLPYMCALAAPFICVFATFSMCFEPPSPLAGFFPFLGRFVTSILVRTAFLFLPLSFCFLVPTVLSVFFPFGWDRKEGE